MLAAARHIIEEELIFENEQTGEARRVSLDKDLLLHKAAAQGATESLLQELENTFLLRRESNSLGGFNYEISHDTLLAPVIKAKRERLLAEREERAAQDHAQALERARKAEADARHEAARRRRASILAVAAFVLFLAATVMGLLAYQERREAKEALAQKIAAEKQRIAAENKITEAENTKKRAEIAAVRLKARDIRARADSLQADYPSASRALYRDARMLVQEMLRVYPGDTTLKNALSKLNP